MPAKAKAGKSKRSRDSGDRRGEAKTPTVAIATTAPPPTPPPILKNDRPAQRRFRQLYADAPWLGPSDAYTVASLVWIQTFVEEVAKDVERGSVVTSADTGREYVHPKVRVLFEAMRESRELTGILALDASSRARLGLQEAQAESLLQRLRSERLVDAAAAAVPVIDLGDG